jgi:hypothetical protein
MSRGVCLSIDFVLRPIDTVREQYFFFEHSKSIFIPYFNEPKELEDFARCEAVLLMDNCSPRMGEAVIAILTRERVTVITFATHTTISSKCLMWCYFAPLKTLYW